MNLMSSKGTSLTMAPEILKGENNLISFKNDIWSLGTIIYYMIFKEYPYNDQMDFQIVKEINEINKLKLIDNN